ncbi:MAG TPA: RNA pseudouridine synthase, partial [Dokdonella sp.]
MTETRSSLNATVPDRLAGRRFDQALAELFPDFSRSRLSAWIRSGDALLDGQRVVPRHIVLGGEQVTLDAKLEREIGAEPEAIELRIVHEDADV